MPATHVPSAVARRVKRASWITVCERQWRIALRRSRRSSTAVGPPRDAQANLSLRSDAGQEREVRLLPTSSSRGRRRTRLVPARTAISYSRPIMDEHSSPVGPRRLAGWRDDGRRRRGVAGRRIATQAGVLSISTSALGAIDLQRRSILRLREVMQPSKARGSDGTHETTICSADTRNV